MITSEFACTRHILAYFKIKIILLCFVFFFLPCGVRMWCTLYVFSFSFVVVIVDSFVWRSNKYCIA